MTATGPLGPGQHPAEHGRCHPLIAPATRVLGQVDNRVAALQQLLQGHGGHVHLMELDPGIDEPADPVERPYQHDSAVGGQDLHDPATDRAGRSGHRDGCHCSTMAL